MSHTVQREWLIYTIDVEVRVAKPAGQGAFELQLDGRTRTDAVTSNQAGTWDSWRSARKLDIELHASVQTILVRTT